MYPLISFYGPAPLLNRGKRADTAYLIRFSQHIRGHLLSSTAIKIHFKQKNTLYLKGVSHEMDLAYDDMHGYRPK
jgi:hypothetical protein